MWIKKIYKMGDQLEDKVRAKLSHFPIVYAALGGAGIILFWRGIWHTTDVIVEHFFGTMPWWDGILSIAIGMTLLLTIGLFVTSFIGDAILISGLKSDKKLAEKTEAEVLAELQINDQILEEVKKLHKRIGRLERAANKEQNNPTP